MYNKGEYIYKYNFDNILRTLDVVLPWSGQGIWHCPTQKTTQEDQGPWNRR